MFAASEEFLELIKSALLAALEGSIVIYNFFFHAQSFPFGKLNLLFCFTALGPGALFGLATISHKVGLYDVQGPVPIVKNVFVPADSDASLPIELEDAMPLLSFLAPVCY